MFNFISDYFDSHKVSDKEPEKEYAVSDSISSSDVIENNKNNEENNNESFKDNDNDNRTSSEIFDRDSMSSGTIKSDLSSVPPLPALKSFGSVQYSPLNFLYNAFTPSKDTLTHSGDFSPLSPDFRSRLDSSGEAPRHSASFVELIQTPPSEKLESSIQSPDQPHFIENGSKNIHIGLQDSQQKLNDLSYINPSVIGSDLPTPQNAIHYISSWLQGESEAVSSHQPVTFSNSPKETISDISSSSEITISSNSKTDGLNDNKQNDVLDSPLLGIGIQSMFENILAARGYVRRESREMNTVNVKPKKKGDKKTRRMSKVDDISARHTLLQQQVFNHFEVDEERVSKTLCHYKKPNEHFDLEDLWYHDRRLRFIFSSNESIQSSSLLLHQTTQPPMSDIITNRSALPKLSFYSKDENISSLFPFQLNQDPLDNHLLHTYLAFYSMNSDTLGMPFEGTHTPFIPSDRLLTLSIKNLSKILL